MAEEGREEKDAREEATAPPPNAEGLGADQATGLADPGGVRSVGADQATCLEGPAGVSIGGADQPTGLAGPRGVRSGYNPVAELVDLGGHDLRSGMGMGSTLVPQAQHGMVATATTSIIQGIGSTLAPHAQRASFVVTAPLRRSMAGVPLLPIQLNKVWDHRLGPQELRRRYHQLACRVHLLLAQFALIALACRHFRAI